MIDSIINGFEVWTDAQGVKSKGRVKSIDNISLEGIARLRELILDFAIRGKLVPQDENANSASLLLKEIKEGKSKLVKEGKIKNEKTVSDIEPSEIPFEIPESWIWCRLADVSILINGDRGQNYPSKDYYVEEGVPFITAANLGERYLNHSTLNYITEERYELLRSGHIQTNDILYCLRGSLGKCAIIEGIEKGAIASSLCIVRSFSGINTNYLLNYFLSSLGKVMIRRYDNGTAQPNLSASDVKTYLFPLPPLEEQVQIVTKVNELMSLCDKLEEEQTKNLTTHHHLVKFLLETLTQANDADELQSSWENISKHFDTLFCTEDSIEQLKKTILQLASMGKLTKQEPNDDLGSEVLNQVLKEKEKLAEKGVIKKPNKPYEITDDEKPFNIPEKWAWARLSDTGIGSTGKTPSTSVSKYFGGDIPFIGPGQITENGTICDSDKTLTEEGSEYSTIANAGDIIMVCIGGSIGKCAIVNSKITFNQQLNCISPLIFDSQYLYNAFNAPFFKEQILKKATGSATPIINRGKWEEIVISVPPKSEQVRIVSRINELFGLCDLLTERIKRGQVIQELLSRTIVE
jgi:type I restriction enzyme, S subunit